MSTALYRKWRSQTFDEVIGQEHVTRTLRNALREGRVAHAYLFSGPRGTGKTSTARILAKALNCEAPEENRPCNECPRCVALNDGRFMDLIEIDAASNNSVEDVRELREKVGFQPAEGRVKIYIIDEVHMLSGSAFNALLKTLEEPPPHVRFILATTEPHKIPATVLSRCQRFDFRRIPVQEIAGHLRHIVTAEARQAEDEALMAIARSAQGCMRDAVSLLDQMLSAGGTVTFAQVQESLGAVSAQHVAAFVDALAERHIAAGLGLIQELAAGGVSLLEFDHQVVEHLRGVLLAQMTNDERLLEELPGESKAAMQRQARQLSPAQLLFAIRRFAAAGPEMKGGFQPQLPLEMALIECVQGPLLTAPAAPAAQSAQPAPTAQHAPPPVAQAAPAAHAPIPAQAAPAHPDPAHPDPAQADPLPVDAAAVARLRARWKDFLKLVRVRCDMKVAAALNSVRDIAIGGNQVALAFGNNSFVIDMLAKPDTQQRVAAVLGEFLGSPVTVEAQPGEHARLTSAVPVVHAQTATNGGPDPLVEYAVSELNAEILRDA